MGRAGHYGSNIEVNEKKKGSIHYSMTREKEYLRPALRTPWTLNVCILLRGGGFETFDDLLIT